ncbi:hypothetical protein ACOHYD_06780 [Desulfobacterota bacterium M19]
MRTDKCSINHTPAYDHGCPADFITSRNVVVRLRSYASLSGTLIVLLLISLLSGSALAASGSLTHQEALTMFREANDFFRQAGKVGEGPEAVRLYNKALRRYERLRRSGIHNGKLYYNIGNTWFRLHDTGRAILNYRRAQRYIAGDENLAQNLAFVKSLQPDKIVPRQRSEILKTLFFWHYDLPVNIRWWLFAASWLLLWGVLLVHLRRRSRVGAGVLWPLVPALLLGGSLLVSYRYPPAPAGVLTAKEVMARKGDGLIYKPSFTTPLHAGLEFRLLERRGGWWHIRLINGRECWIPAVSAAII